MLRQPEMNTIVGETWLVVGCNKGIGLEFVKQLVALRKSVIATTKSLDRADDLKRIASQNQNCHLFQLDITDKGSIQEATQQIQRLLGDRPLDVLLHNVVTRVHSNDQLSEEVPITVDKMLRNNILGPVQATQAFLPFLRRSLQPKVIFMSSSTADPQHVKEQTPAQTTTCEISRSGVMLLNAMFSIDDHCKGITFVALHPGRPDSGMSRQIEAEWPINQPDEPVQRMLSVIHSVSPDMNGWMYNYNGELMT